MQGQTFQRHNKTHWNAIFFQRAGVNAASHIFCAKERGLLQIPCHEFHRNRWRLSAQKSCQFQENSNAAGIIIGPWQALIGIKMSTYDNVGSLVRTEVGSYIFECFILNLIRLPSDVAPGSANS